MYIIILEKNKGVEMEKKLYRSTKNRMIFGVCGGLGEYFGVDPTLIRLFWIAIITFTNGLGGVIGYFVAYIIIPEG